jgi:hypothetical protein
VLAACGSTVTQTVTASLATAPPAASISTTVSSTSSSSPATPPPATPAATPTAVTASTSSSDTPSHPLDALPTAQGTRLVDGQGTGNGSVPAGPAAITVPKDNWVLAASWTCPAGSSGEGGMGTVITFDFLRPDGAALPGDDQQQMGGDFGSGSSLVTKGGNLRVRVTPIAASCQWHIAIDTGTA